jgi:glycosyltransferase involved in cell wall biosynthesis
MSPRKKPTVDLVIPVYNEAGVVAQTHARIRAAVDALPYAFAFLYVDDGSSDATVEDLRAIAASDARVRVLSLSRNFGRLARR